MITGKTESARLKGGRAKNSNSMSICTPVFNKSANTNVEHRLAYILFRIKENTKTEI